MARDLGRILDECLGELAAGASVESCLARYPQHAAELAPMLAAARDLTALQSIRLSEPARLRAKATLRSALVGQHTASKERGHPFSPARRLAWGMAGIFVVVLVLAIGAGTVAASQPGDLAYRVRVALEELPVTLQTSMQDRLTFQMRIADRRLADVASHGYDPIAVRAMLAADQAAVALAEGLGEDARNRVAARVAVQVQTLAELAQAAPDPKAANALRLAAQQAVRVAERLGGGAIKPQPTPAGPGFGRPESTAQPSRSPATPIVGPSPTSRPRASATATVGPQPTRRLATSTATATRGPQATSRSSGSPATATAGPQRTSQPSRPPATATGGPQHTPSPASTAGSVPTVETGNPQSTPGFQGSPEPGPQNTPEPGPQNTPEPNDPPQGGGGPPEPTSRH
jgi:hypothetical protein